MKIATDFEFAFLKESIRQDVPDAVKEFLEENPEVVEDQDTVGLSYVPIGWKLDDDSAGRPVVSTEVELVRYRPDRRGGIVREVVGTFNVNRLIPPPPTQH